MKKIILKSLLCLLARLPLPAIRALGAGVGLLSLRLSNKSAKRLPHNLLITGLATPESVEQMTRDTAKALGMTLAEAALIAWQKDRARITRLFEVDESFYAVKALLEAGKNIVFLTPHIGNFEVAVKYFAYHLPMNIQILYKPSKDPVIEEIMVSGRSEVNITPVPTNRKGVLSMMKHLKSGGCLGILPDNVASGGDGEWVKFFGQDVYATSLAAKICQQPDTVAVIVQNLRTKTGFKSKCVPFKPSNSDTHDIMQELYKEIEKLVREAPEQYYWSYDRFRHPDKAKPKPLAESRS
jgi:KDO2-lipid IV(A) lauroyltransferase